MARSDADGAKGKAPGAGSTADESSTPRWVLDLDKPGSWWLDNLHWIGPLAIFAAGWLSR